jgi:4-hydroxyphenylpyruvate dioxygenase
MKADPLDFQGIDYVEFYVSNARQAAHSYRTALVLGLLAYAELETGVRERASWLVGCGQVRFKLTSPLSRFVRQSFRGSNPP